MLSLFVLAILKPTPVFGPKTIRKQFRKYGHTKNLAFNTLPLLTLYHNSFDKGLSSYESKLKR